MRQTYRQKLYKTKQFLMGFSYMMAWVYIIKLVNDFLLT